MSQIILAYHWILSSHVDIFVAELTIKTIAKGR